MKNVLILHGSYGNPHKNWYQYVKKHAEEKGYAVNIPQLPHIEELDLEETYKFLLNKNFINSETTIIGHSSGATYILGILQRLPGDLIIQKAILVAGFIDDKLTEKLFKVVPKIHYKKLFPKRWDWRKIRKSCQEFIIFHAPTDPYVQMRHAKILRDILGAKLIVIADGQHFSINTGGEHFKEFPELLDYL